MALMSWVGRESLTLILWISDLFIETKDVLFFSLWI